VTTYALSSVSRSQGGSGTNCINPTPNNIPAFWAPILLVHLGGPDTITAYALEDNELWLRHLLQLVIQASTASYSLFKSWGKDPLKYIAIPIFVAGITKYGDRVLVLWLASSKKFRDIQSEKNRRKEQSSSALIP
jgi:membrane protein required for beta-lactamase induction